MTKQPVRVIKLNDKPKKTQSRSIQAVQLAGELEEQLSKVAETCNALKDNGCEVEFRFDVSGGSWKFNYTVKRIDVIKSQ